MREGFAHRLARDLGMTVAQLDRTMTVGEFIRWAAFVTYENEAASN